MKICFITNEYPPDIIGGVGIYIKEISQALTNLGHEVFVISKSEKNREERILDGKVKVYKVPYCKIGFFSFLRNYLPKTIERLEYGYSTSKKLNELVKNYEIDIVESPESWMGGFWYYLFKNSPPLVIKLHTPEGIIFKWNGGVSEEDMNFFTKLEKFWFRKSTLTFGVTNSILQLTSRYYNIDMGNISVYNPLDFDLFLNNEYQEGCNYSILYVGRLEFRKGVHLLCKAFPLIINEYPEVEFTFIGSDCGMEWYVEKKIKELGCEDNVKILPHVNREEIVNFYSKATVCVIPSLWENFPYSCIEPMALGKPVIASESGGMKEIVNHGKNGLLFKNGSHKDLAEKIKFLLNNKDMRKKLGDNASKYVKEVCNPKRIAEETLKIYRKVLK